ncbi:MAG TPA: DinB family protein [Acidimicrobiales bacterium]
MRPTATMARAAIIKPSLATIVPISKGYADRVTTASQDMTNFCQRDFHRSQIIRAAQWVMPIPAPPSHRANVASAVLSLFGRVHDEVRAEISHLDDAGLNWMPVSGTNSIATIVTHLLGSEAETLRSVAGVPAPRNRDDEFTQGPQRRLEIEKALAAADELIAELRAEIGPNRLRTLVALPTLPADDRRTGLVWLLGNYGHAREHLGHIQLTSQLYQSGSVPLP